MPVSGSLKTKFFLFWGALLLLTAPAAPVAGQDGTGEDVATWNSYVDLANDLETIFRPALEAYLETFGHDPEYHEPVQGSGLVANYFLVLMESPEDLNRVLESAQAAAARGGTAALDGAVREMLPYIKELWGTLVRSRDYHLEQASASAGQSGELRARLYSVEDLHAKIFTDYQGFSATYEVFRAALNREGVERRRRDMQALQKKGLLIHSALLEILDAGQGLQDHLNIRQITGASPAGHAPDDLRPFLDRLESAAQALEAARAASSDQEGLPVEALTAFHDQLAAVRAEADGLTGPKTAGGRPQAASADGLARELGLLVDIYNNLTGF